MAGSEGPAYFVRGSDEGYLKVSLFGPFYGSYVVFELDMENYQYAYVSGPNESYLMFLSRTPTVSEEQKAQFVESAGKRGFAAENLIFVNQEGWLWAICAADRQYRRCHKWGNSIVFPQSCRT
jgi:apolipoprotein D and lipocalin family protein